MTRLAHAWRALEHEQKLAAIAAIGLLVSMFLPWYSQTNTVVVGNAAKSTATSLSAFAAFSFVEAAVLLVSGGVLLMLFARAERRSFQLPGGDGTIVMIAGSWAALLIFYRMLDKPGLHGTQRITATVGVQWGIFIALATAGLLAYAGARMRAGRRPAPPLTRAGAGPPPEGAGAKRSPARTARPSRAGLSSEPPLAGGESSPVRAAAAAPSAGGLQGPRPASGRPRYPPAPSVPPRGSARRPLAAAKTSEQLSFEDPGPEPGRRPS